MWLLLALLQMCRADSCSVPGPPRHGGLNDFGKVTNEFRHVQVYPCVCSVWCEK